MANHIFKGSGVAIVTPMFEDGSVNYDVTTNANQTQTITHSYAENGEYFIVIVGEVEDIKQFSTNAIVVWNRL